MLEYLLFTGYLLFFTWLITRLPVFKSTGLTRPQLISVYFLKIIAGIFYGWIGIYYGGHAKMWDTWIYHTNSLYEYHLMQTDPYEYATNLFRNSYSHGFSRFFESSGSYWNDLKGSVFIKLLSIIDVFSRGFYFVNVIFYNFLSLFGAVAFYRVMKDALPGRDKLLYYTCFFIPSFLYWTSGIHKEGLIFTGIALAVSGVYFSYKENRFSSGRIIAIISGVLIVLLLRNALTVLFVPALLIWIASILIRKHTKLVYITGSILFILLFFTSKHIVPGLDLPGSIAAKQQEFLKLRKGKATVNIHPLKPTASGYLENLPQSLELTLLRPYPGDIHNTFTLAAAVEMLLLLALFLLFLFRHGPFPSNSTGLLGFCIFFSIAVLLAIGYSNNNIGAIARYRSVVLPFLIIPMIYSISISFRKKA